MSVVSLAIKFPRFDGWNTSSTSEMGLLPLLNSHALMRRKTGEALRTLTQYASPKAFAML